MSSGFFILNFLYFSEQLPLMQPEMFKAGVEMPEAPKRSFFQSLFGGGQVDFDRDELCEFFFAPLVSGSPLIGHFAFQLAARTPGNRPMAPHRPSPTPA